MSACTMIKGIIRRLIEKRDSEAARKAMFARRAVRVCNRKPDLAAKYEAVHAVLARGRE